MSFTQSIKAIASIVAVWVLLYLPLAAQVRIPGPGGVVAVTPIAVTGQIAFGSTGGGSVTSGTVDMTGSTILVMGISDFEGVGTSTPGDNASGPTNTWTCLTRHNNSISDGGKICYVVNPHVGAGMTFSITTAVSSTFPSACVKGFSGVVTSSPKDQQNNTTSDATASLATGSITPTTNNQVVFAMLTFGASRTPAVDSGFNYAGTSAVDYFNYSASSHIGSSCAYKVQTTAAAVNPTWSWTTNTDAVADQVSFIHS